MTFQAPFEAMMARIFVPSSLRCEAYDMACPHVVPVRYAYIVRHGREYVPQHIEPTDEAPAEETP